MNRTRLVNQITRRIMRETKADTTSEKAIEKKLRSKGWNSVHTRFDTVSGIHSYHPGDTPSVIVRVNIGTGIITIHDRDSKLRPIMPGKRIRSIPSVMNAHGMLNHRRNG